MSVMVTRLREKTVLTVKGDLDAVLASELLDVLRRYAAETAGTLVIDVARAREVSPVALAVFKHCELWPRLWLRGLSHNGERILRHLAPAAAAVEP